MEIMLRCAVPDRPGALSKLTGVIAAAGGDIEAVEVVEAAEGRALDDLVVRVTEPGVLARLVERLESEPDVELVHGGPSRGHPGDAVTRVATTLEALLVGAVTLEHALAAIIGGQVRAATAELMERSEAPKGGAKTLVLGVDSRALVLRRDYRFTDTERSRADSLLRVCLAAHASNPTPASA